MKIERILQKKKDYKKFLVPQLDKISLYLGSHNCIEIKN